MDSHTIAYKHPPSVMVAQTRSQKSRFGSPQHVATHLCGSPKRSGSWASTNSRWQSRNFSCAPRQIRGRPLAKLNKPHAFCGSPVLATRTYGRSRMLRTWLHVHERWRTWRNVGASVTRQVGRWRRLGVTHTLRASVTPKRIMHTGGRCRARLKESGVICGRTYTRCTHALCDMGRWARERMGVLGVGITCCVGAHNA